MVVACGAAFVLHLLARRREAGRAAVVPFVRRSVSLFSNRNFGALMGAVFLAVLGDGIVQGALAKTIAFGGEKGFSLDEARSPQHILALVLLTYLPYMVISPFMGVVIDRFDRRKLLMLANGFRAAVIVLIGLAATSLPDWALIAALILTLASTRLVLAIKSAGMPSVLGGRNLMQGNSISQAGQAVFQLMGAGLALVATKATSASVVIMAGAVVYAVGAGFASRTRNLTEGSPHKVRFAEEAKRILHDIAEGVRQIAKRPAAALGVTSFLTLRTLISFASLVFALQARDILGGGDSSNTAVIIAGLAAAAGAGLGFVAAQVLKDRVPAAPADRRGPDRGGRRVRGARRGEVDARAVGGGVRRRAGLLRREDLRRHDHAAVAARPVPGPRVQLLRRRVQPGVDRPGARCCSPRGPTRTRAC